ncbi:MAG: methyltransferase domain-containing protein [Verrucomicrobia bacterium]|nr:methyltransferase domain-containing protein [Verrucomicrobiota bacterium]
MTYSNSSSNITWKAKEYHELSFAQQDAAIEFLKHLNISSKDNILDVGCGNGRITAQLATIANHGFVLGIDISPEMIKFASEHFSKDSYPNLQFQLGEAENFCFEHQFDIIFSSFVLQWVQNKNVFLKNCYSSLSKKGLLAITMPLCISQELQKSIDVVIALSDWASFFKDFHPGWFFINSDEFKDCVVENGFKIKYCFSHIQEVSFPSRSSIEKYILLWFPFLKPLPRKKQKIFFKQIIDEYLKTVSIQPDGSVKLRIPRLDIIAEKISP